LTERRPGFLTKYFSPEEVEYCQNRPERLTARWAAKEAVRKAFGGLGWPIPLYSRIAVSHRPGGAPVILVEGAPVEGLSISLTHDAGLGAAVVALSPLGRRTRWLWGRLPADLKMPLRPVESNKGTFGTVVVIAGSPEFPGAAILCALGALRGGAGKVKALASPAGMADAPPELIRVPVSSSERSLGSEAIRDAEAALDSAQAVVCGPGLGQSAATRDLLRELFDVAHAARWGLVLDADALNVCAGDSELCQQIPHRSVLTPHPLEAARLARVEVAEIEGNRQGAAAALARELGTVLVLKGPGTVVADPEGRCWVDDHATSALATGGTGDVLAGLIAALLAQGLEPFEAARSGVFLHGEAGTRLARLRGRAGILASEVADSFVEVAEAVRRQQEGEATSASPRP
jgi:NAD(P)H-hydrate epimerase